MVVLDERVPNAEVCKLCPMIGFHEKTTRVAEIFGRSSYTPGRDVSTFCIHLISSSLQNLMRHAKFKLSLIGTTQPSRRAFS